MKKVIGMGFIVLCFFFLACLLAKDKPWQYRGSTVELRFKISSIPVVPKSFRDALNAHITTWGEKAWLTTTPMPRIMAAAA